MSIPRKVASLGLGVVLAFIGMGRAFGQCSAIVSDGSFAATQQPASPGALGNPGTAGNPATYYINRVVGPGVAGQFLNADGTLNNWQTLVSNGVISAMAQVSVSISLIDQGTGFSTNNSGTVTLIVNGQPAGQVPWVWTFDPQFGTWTGGFSGCMQFSTQYLKFPALGQVQNPPLNQISFSYSNPCCSNWAVLVGPLSFKAMYPIILVHGWNSGPWEWGPVTPDPNGICGAGQLSSDQGRTFINTLVAAGAPFYCTIMIPRQASILVGADRLENGIPDVTFSVAQAAAEFGSRHAHIITNSKGGLFTRAFLDWNAAQDPGYQVGIVSVTTLDTPHHGSVLSDTAVAVTAGVHDLLPPFLRLFYNLGTLFGAAQLANAFGPGNDDMTVAMARTFDVAHPAPPTQYQIAAQTSGGNPAILTINNPAYFSTSGDADLDHSGTLQSNEADPYIFLQAQFQWQQLGTVYEITTLTDPLLAVISLTTSFQANDTAVTVQSARYSNPSPGMTGFSEIVSGPHLANHATILCSEVGVVPLYCYPSGTPIPQGAAADTLTAIRFAEETLSETLTAQ